MFRDPHIAAKEKEIAHLRDELDKAQAKEKANIERLQKADEELTKARQQKTSRRTSPIPQPAPGRIPGINKTFRALKYKILNSHPIFWLILAAFVAFGGIQLFYYFTNIQEGVVTGKAYHREVTVCDADGFCTTTPEHWTVDIAYEGRTATWQVRSHTYNSLRRGHWFCYVDSMHPRSACKGPTE